MKQPVSVALVFAAIFLSFVLQNFLPKLSGLGGAQILFVPALFCYAAIAFPFPIMLLAAVYTGLLSDIDQLHVIDGNVEIALGWSILIYAAFGSLCQGFRDGFLRGHWWLLSLLSALTTISILALQFAMISFRRGGFIFDQLVLWRILTPGVLSLLISPFIYWVFSAAHQPHGGRRTRLSY